MNRLEKIISADIRNTRINKKDMDYYLDSEQTENKLLILHSLSAQTVSPWRSLLTKLVLILTKTTKTFSQ